MTPPKEFSVLWVMKIALMSGEQDEVSEENSALGSRTRGAD